MAIKDTQPTLANPLTKQHLADINDALRAIAEARLAISRANQAGIDTGSRMADLETLERQLKQIKAVYFPGSV